MGMRTQLERLIVSLLYGDAAEKFGDGGRLARAGDLGRDLAGVGGGVA